ncbi:MAG: hypothetical protein R3B40_06215 [Polyangiales bacterium]|nr:hypothetical protein [Myxococcales bacterium]MCB9657525.1 hypothetical protein [Sandaracinaceae bacterium]
MSATHYKAPQTIAPLGIVFGGVAALLGAFVLAPIYALAIAYIPIVYLNALLTAGFGGLTGFGVVMALRAGHFQNAALSYVLGFGALLFAYWMHWIAWVAVLEWRADMPVEVLPLLLPPVLMEIVGLVYEQGTWSVRSSDPVSGGVLGLVWAIEALIFFGAGFVGIVGVVGSGTYCERCRAWCDVVGTRLLAHDDSGTLPDAVNQRQDWAALVRAEPEPGAAMYHTVEVSQCPRCRETSTLTLSTVTISHDSKGNEQRNTKVDADRVFISAADAARLLG